MNKSLDKPYRLSRTTIYKDPWVNLYTDKVQFPAGRIVDKHHMLEFDRQAVAVIVENDKEEILMVQAYRYPTDSIEWEIPAGGIDPGEAILEAGEREVLEETGHTSTDHELIYTYHPMNGIANKVFHITRARVIEKTADFDKNEVKLWQWKSTQEIEEMINTRTLKDGYTLSAVLLHFSPAFI